MSGRPSREERFRTLVAENRPLVRRNARAYADDPHDAEDLHQNILLEVWRSLPSYRGNARPGTWLYRVALNTALARERKREIRRGARVGDEILPEGRSFPPPDRRAEDRRRVLDSDGAARPVAARFPAPRRRVDVQIDLLESVLWWYVSPLALGAGPYVVGLPAPSGRRPSPWPWWSAGAPSTRSPTTSPAA